LNLLIGDLLLASLVNFLTPALRQLVPAAEASLASAPAHLAFGNAQNAALRDAIFDRAAALSFGLVFVCLLYIFDLYHIPVLMSRRATLSRLLMACVTGVFPSSAYLYLTHSLRFGRAIVVQSFVILPCMAYVWRRVYLKNSSALLPTARSLILGTGSEAEFLCRILNENGSRCEFVGLVNLNGHRDSQGPCTQPVGSANALSELVKTYKIRRLLVGIESIPAELAPAITKLKFEGVDVCHSAELAMTVEESLPLELLSDSWLWFAEGFGLLRSHFYRRVKRLTDIFLSMIGLILAFPICLLVAVAIKLNTRGPVFYRQKRVGWQERSFTLLKFRSMKTDAESNGEAQWACQNDPRITRVGRWLRRLRLDEIPQLVNVLLGEMSFIGPRPERPEFVRELKQSIPLYHLRHYAVPGLTGWAQVKYPYGASIEDAKRKLEYDLYYILQASPALDVRILFKTIGVVLLQRGSR
jgi:sugar transferase (PEP-CTERM system associated)